MNINTNIMKITETQLATFKKYTSVLYSAGSRVITLSSVSDKNNGWDSTGTAHVEIMWDGNIEQEEWRCSKILGDVHQFKFDGRDLDAEYNEFLLFLDSKVSEAQNNLVELKAPEQTGQYKNKNKTFLAHSARKNRKVIKYINKLNN